MAEPTISVLELCVRLAVVREPNRRRAGLLAGKVAAFVDEWARMMRETGNDDPTIEEWRQWAAVSVRTAYYRQRDFRLLFAEWHELPTVLARYVNRSVAAKRGAVVPVELVPVDLVPA